MRKIHLSYRTLKKPLITSPILAFFNKSNLKLHFCEVQTYIAFHDDKFIHIKQYFCLIPHNDTSRPLIVPQEYLNHFDDFLLPCNIPTQIVKPLRVIKHLVSSPLDDKDTSCYTALSKQSHSYNELLFIAAKTISFMVQTEGKHIYSDHKSLTKSPYKIKHSQTTSEKLSTMLNNCTLKDLTQMLDPYIRNPSDSPITTLNHLIHCYDRTSKLLQTLDLDSQRITQSSQAIQSALESMKTLFNTFNLHYIISQVIQISLIFVRYWTLFSWTFSTQTTGNIPILLSKICDIPFQQFLYKIFHVFYFLIYFLALSFSTLF